MLARIKKGESGQGALIAVLLLLVLGSLTIPPLLGLVQTGLKAGQIHEAKLQEFYAADSGVEDALWQIKNDKMEDLFGTYNPYDYAEEYSYSFDNTINEKSVDVTIQNIWLPEGYISEPTPAEAQAIIDDGTLVLTGRAITDSEYQLKIVYNYQNLEDWEDIWDDLEITTLGIWLPAGFIYVEGSSNLEQDPYDWEPEDPEPYKGGQAIVWDFGSGALFTEFPSVDLEGYPLVAKISFQFTSPPNRRPNSAVSWISTDGLDDISYTWDADTRMYSIESTGSDTETGSQSVVEAYTAKSEIRKMSNAMQADYFATGNSLLSPTGDVNYRNRLHKEASATVETDEDGLEGIPSQGMVEAAFLYWTGWIDYHGYDPEGGDIVIFEDDCTDLYSPASNWDYGDDWHESGSYTAFYAHHDGDHGSNDRILTTKEGLVDLSDTSGKEVTVSWRSWNWDSGAQDTDDCLYYSYSGDGGSTWSSWQSAFCNDIGTSPDTYSYQIPDSTTYRTENARIRFGISTYSGSNEYVYVDNVSISTEGSAGGSLEYPDDPTPEKLTTLVEDTARVNTVRFGIEPSNTVTIEADYWEIEPTTGTTWEGTWSYCCLKDVTDLVTDWIEEEDLGENGAGTYILGHVVAENEVDPGYSFDLYPGSEDTGYPLGTPALEHSLIYQYSHAGWSLILLYTSPQTKGHQLYLYDIYDPDFEFTEAWEPSGYPNPDFDGDGEPGGQISGFLVPEPIEGEEMAAKLTIFAGEGDIGITGEHVEINGDRISEPPINPDGNMWNSQSPGLSEDGIDVDTFYIEWTDGILEPGDTQAQVDLPTGSDGFNLIYIVLSFRSDIITGGTIGYLIHG